MGVRMAQIIAKAKAMIVPYDVFVTLFITNPIVPHTMAKIPLKPNVAKVLNIV